MKAVLYSFLVFITAINGAQAAEDSFLCTNKEGRKVAKIQFGEFVENYERYTCYAYDHMDCCDEPPYGECIERRGERADATINFYNTIMPIPSTQTVSFTVYRNYDHKYNRRWYGGAALSGNEKYSFYMRRGFNPDTDPISHSLSLEKRARYSEDNIWKSYNCYEVNNMDSVYKILRQDEWLKLKNSGEFQGSPGDLRDGFIHLSTEEQVEYIVEKYFKDEPVVYVAEFPSDSFGQSDLKWELSSSSKKLYPHLYDEYLFFNKVISHQVINH